MVRVTLKILFRGGYNDELVVDARVATKIKDKWIKRITNPTSADAEVLTFTTDNGKTEYYVALSEIVRISRSVPGC